MRLIGLILALGLTLAPLAAEAQQAEKVARIAFLSTSSAASGFADAFTQGLQEFGYVEGRNIRIEYRWADGHYDRLPRLAKELVELKVDLIVCTGGAPSARAAKAATKTIPVVFLTRDPVATGLVTSVARPGGNLTGIDLITAELDAKRLEILKETLPTARQVAVLWNPEGPLATQQRNRVEDAARALGLRIRFMSARRSEDIEPTFTVLARERPDALLVAADPMFNNERARIVALAARVRLPAAYFWREFVEAGGLLSYAVNLQQMHRRLAVFVDKILKGAKPADLPVEQPTRFELVINLKTAKALGLTIPQTVILQADQVIQ
jgi:putative ABC transport system substrate-binding protein